MILCNKGYITTVTYQVIFNKGSDYLPPKAKFTREEIIAAALEVAREKGIKAVTAREVGRYLGTSSSPVFVAFGSMEELISCVHKAAVEEYSNYIADSVNYTPVFKQFGFRMIEYARQQPNLFLSVCIMNDPEQDYETMTMNMPKSDFCIQTIMKQTGYDYEKAKLLFKQVLLTGLGIAFLVSSKMCDFSDEDLNIYLGMAYQGTVLAINNLQKEAYTVFPHKNNYLER